MKYLYKKSNNNEDVLVKDNLEIEIFCPTLRRLIIKGEKKSVKLLAVRLCFWILTLGKAKLYCLREHGKLVHTSYVIPKCYKFSFLYKTDYEIGPCMTYPEFRGRGYYPMMLCYICSTVGVQNTNFYMIVEESNFASIKGIEKAGFERCGTIRVTKFTKRYLIETRNNY